MAEIHKLAERLLYLNKEAEPLLEALNICRIVFSSSGDCQVDGESSENNSNSVSEGNASGPTLTGAAISLGPPIHEQVGPFYCRARKCPQLLNNPVFAPVRKVLNRKFPEYGAVTAKTGSYQQMQHHTPVLLAELEPFFCSIVAAVEYIERGLVLLLQSSRLIGLSFELAHDLCENILKLLVNWSFVHKLLFAVPSHELKIVLSGYALLSEINTSEKNVKFPFLVRFFKDYGKFPWEFAVEQLQPVANVILSLLPKIKNDIDGHLFTTGDQLKLSKLFYLSVDIHGSTNIQNLPEAIRQYSTISSLPAIAIISFACFPSEVIKHPSLVDMVCSACHYGWLLPVTGDVSLCVSDLLLTALRILPKGAQSAELKKTFKDALAKGTEKAPQLHRDQRDVIARYLRQATAISSDLTAMQEKLFVVAALLRRGSEELEWYLTHLASPLNGSNAGVHPSIVSSFLSATAAYAQQEQSSTSPGSSATGGTSGAHGSFGAAAATTGISLGAALGQPGPGGIIVLSNTSTPAGLQAILGAGTSTVNSTGSSTNSSTSGEAGSSGALGLVAASNNAAGSLASSSAASETGTKKSTAGGHVVSPDSSIYAFILGLRAAADALNANKKVVNQALEIYLEKKTTELSALLLRVLESNPGIEAIIASLLRSLSSKLETLQSCMRQHACQSLEYNTVVEVEWLRFQLCLVLPTLSVTHQSIFDSGFASNLSTMLFFYHKFFLNYELFGPNSWCPGMYRAFQWHFPVYYNQFCATLITSSLPEVLHNSIKATIALVYTAGATLQQGDSSLRRVYFKKTGRPGPEDAFLGEEHLQKGHVEGELLYRYTYAHDFTDFLFKSLSKLVVQVVHLNGLAQILLNQHNSAFGFSSSSANAAIGSLGSSGGPNVLSSQNLPGVAGVGLSNPGHSLSSPSHQKAQVQRTRQWQKWYLIAKYIVLGYSSFLKVEVAGFVFQPMIYLRSALLVRVFEQINALAFYGDEVLQVLSSDDSLVADDCALLEVKRPLLFVHDVLLYMKGINSIGEWSSIDTVSVLEQVFFDVLDPAVVEKYMGRMEGAFEYRNPAAQKARMKERKKTLGTFRKNPFVLTYTVWLFEFFSSKVGSAEAIFAFNEKKFVMKLPMCRYVETFEVLSLCEITGTKGYAFIDMKLTQLMCTLIALIKEFLAQHIGTFSALATGWQSEQALDLLKRLKGWRDVAQQAALLGCVTLFRNRLYELIGDAVRGTAPYVYNFVKNLHERYPANYGLAAEYKDIDFLANSVGMLQRIDTSMQEAVTACLWEHDQELMDTIIAILPAAFSALSVLAASDESSSYLPEYDALANNFHAMSAAFILISGNIRQQTVNVQYNPKVTETLMHQKYLAISTALLYYLTAKGDLKNEYPSMAAPWVILRQFMDQTSSMAHELESIIPYLTICDSIQRYT